MFLNEGFPAETRQLSSQSSGMRAWQAFTSSPEAWRGALSTRFILTRGHDSTGRWWPPELTKKGFCS